MPVAVASGMSSTAACSRPVRSRPRSRAHGADQRAGGGGIPRPRTARGRAGLSALLVRGAPQHARRRLDDAARAHRGGSRAHAADPGRLGRRHAAEPLAARRRRAVRGSRGARAGPDRPGHRPRARQRPRHHAAAAHVGHHERRRAVPRARARHRPARAGRGRDGAVHLGRHVRRARDARRDRGARGLAARVERLLRAAGGESRAAVRVRQPLLGRGARAGARAVPLAVPAQRREPRAAHLPDRERPGGADRRKRPRSARSPTCA